MPGWQVHECIINHPESLTQISRTVSFNWQKLTSGFFSSRSSISNKPAFSIAISSLHSSSSKPVTYDGILLIYRSTPLLEYCFTFAALECNAMIFAMNSLHHSYSISFIYSFHTLRQSFILAVSRRANEVSRTCGTPFGRSEKNIQRFPFLVRVLSIIN